MDSATARELPDEFLQSSGTSIERALSLVVRHWRSYPVGHQRQLAQALIALLEPLLKAPPKSVPESLRQECQRVVAAWEERWAGTVANMATFSSTISHQQRAVKFVSVDTTGTEARVQLERVGAGFYQGTAEHPDTIRGAADAAVQAVSQVLAGKGWVLLIDQTSVADTLGKRTVFVQVSARSQGKHRVLLGFCLIDADPARAAVLAVLNATNRFLDLELGHA
jgi:hypothetical protein